MIDTIRKHDVWVFFGAIVIVNAVFIWAIHMGLLPQGAFSMGRFVLLGALLFGLVFGLRGLEGIADLLKPMLVWRVAPIWFLLALVWGAGNMVLLLIGKGIVTGNGLAEVTANLRIVSMPSVMFTVFVSSFIGEIVWISYAVRRLSSTYTVFVAAVITGVVWTLWWLPMLYFEIGIIPGLPLMALLINQTTVALVAAFLYWHTKSGLVVLVGQILFNSSLLIFPVAPTSGGIPTYYAFAICFFLTTLSLYLALGPRPLLDGGMRQAQPS